MSIAGLSLLISSCSSFVELDPKSSLTRENFWQTPKDIEAGLAAMYYSFSRTMANSYYDWGELRGGNYSGSQKDGPDQYYIINDAMTSANGAGLWSNLYQTINRANLCLKYVPDILASPAVKNNAVSEAYAMRALCYFYGVRVWGDVPQFIEPVEEYVAETVYRSREDQGVILSQIVNDLQAAEQYAQPVPTGSTFKRSRHNLMSVYAIMMDVYAWMHDYEKVVDIMENKVRPLMVSNPGWELVQIPQGATQAQFQTAWWAITRKFNKSSALNTQSKERIYYVPYIQTENGTNGNVSYFCSTSQKATPTPALLGSYEPGDKRFAATYSSSRLRDKFWDPNLAFGTLVSDGDLILYRMADLVLLYAEALANQGKIGDAVDELNKIHTRAGLQAYGANSFISTEDLVLAILQEKRVELIGEGKWWFDLVRTGHATDIGGVANPLRYVFPVSKTHLDQNAKIKQNPGYGAGE